MLLSILLAVGLAAQAPAPPDPFAPLGFLEGTWKGDAHGEPGQGASNRTYEFVMKGRFLSVKNRSEYAPPAGRQHGEVHDDWGVFSYDKREKVLVLRQFHVEGFVNEYHLTASGPGFLEFTTVRIENLPPGWRAREVYRRAGPDEFVETFSIAEPGKEFAQYVETRFRRAAR